MINGLFYFSSFFGSHFIYVPLRLGAREGRFIIRALIQTHKRNGRKLLTNHDFGFTARLMFISFGHQEINSLEERNKMETS